MIMVMAFAQLPLFVLNLSIAFSGWVLLFARPDFFRQTHKMYFNLSPEYIRYVAITLSSFTALSHVFLRISEWTIGSPLVGENGWLWVASTIGSAASLFLIHCYFIRVQGPAGDDVRKTNSV